MGWMHATGSGFEQDHAAAAQWYEQAARQGVAEAMYNLGVQYSKGQGVDADPVLARTWIEQAAALGRPKAMESLARMLVRGDGGEADRDGAAEWSYRAGLAYEQRGEGEAARRCLDRAVLLYTGSEQDRLLRMPELAAALERLP